MQLNHAPPHLPLHSHSSTPPETHIPHFTSISGHQFQMKTQYHLTILSTVSILMYPSLKLPCHAFSSLFLYPYLPTDVFLYRLLIIRTSQRANFHSHQDNRLSTTFMKCPCCYQKSKPPPTLPFSFTFSRALLLDLLLLTCIIN